MFQCSACGGRLVFDIATQMLKCDYCNALYEPDYIEKSNISASTSTATTITIDKTANEKFDTTVFTCPECGGEIYSTDETSAGFCSYCGASTILESRMNRQNRPKYIIPFSKTKDDCKQAYINFIKKRPFIPTELKNPDFVDGFRGIYMPYWQYRITQKGMATMTATKPEPSQSLLNTYTLNCQLDAEYDGITHDAASAFADGISEQISPYELEQRKEFNPAYLSGFYADMPDVDQIAYRKQVVKAAESETLKYLGQISAFDKMEIDTGANPPKLNTICEPASLSLLPVWFLSYRNNDRVAYATVNGQTGKVAADLPVDIFKYLISSLLLTIPLFFILNMFFTFKPITMLMISGIATTIFMITYVAELLNIIKKDINASDTGYAANNWDANERLSREIKKSEAEDKAIVFGIFLIPATSFFIVPIIAIILNYDGYPELGLFPLIVWWHLFWIAVLTFRKATARIYGHYTLSEVPGLVASLISIIAGIAVIITNPVHDNWYYGAIIISLVAEIITLLDIIRYYNVLSTRKLPQFNHKGGDDNA